MKRVKGNPELETKISHLQLDLHPLVPLPAGDPHPAFPATLLAYHLLTEQELDDIAHYYHQSTPSIWTHQYPACMNWDKEWLNASKQRRRSSIVSLSRRQCVTQAQAPEAVNEWWTQLINNVAMTESVSTVATGTTPTVARRRSSSAKPSKNLTDAERIAIKRRKVGKFIGLVGMETPAAEIEGRMRDAMESIKLAGQEELRLTEEWYMRRRKIG